MLLSEYESSAYLRRSQTVDFLSVTNQYKDVQHKGGIVLAVWMKEQIKLSDSNTVYDVTYIDIHGSPGIWMLFRHCTAIM